MKTKRIKTKVKKVLMLKKKGKKALKFFYYRSLCALLSPRGHSLDPYEGSPLKRKLTRLVPGNKRSAVCLRIAFDLNGGNYRFWLARKARTKKIDTFVYKVKSNGLEAILIGSGPKLEEIIQTAWNGPRRTKVAHIQEKWFNKPVKFGGKVKKAINDIPWSVQIANSIRENLTPLSPLLQNPNQFDEYSEKGSDELEKAAKARGFFVMRFSNSSYIISPNKKLGIHFAEIASVSTNLRAITNDKQITKEILSNYGLPTPKGRVFEEFLTARDYLRECNYPLVVKPLEGSMGRGITVDVRTEETLQVAWNYAQTLHKHVILEELVSGVDVRVLVIGGKAKAAQMRVPANIVGDGKQSVKLLIEQKNKERLKNPRLDKKLIKLDAYSYQFIERQHHSMSSIPKKGEVVFLHLKANLSAGGDNIVVTEHINPDLLLLAEEAAASLGVNDFWGIDLLVENIFLTRHQQNCKLVEVNSRAALRGVQYPLYGKPVHAPQELIDYLFADEIRNYAVKNKSLTITGVLNSYFLDWVCQQARELDINGHISLVDGEAHAVVCGRESHLFLLFDRLWSCENIKDEAVVDGLYLRDCTVDVEEGFFIKATAQNHYVPQHKIPCKEFDSSQFEINAYELPVKEHYNINIDLFINDFGNHGYVAVPINDMLIKIQRGSTYGITGTLFSSGFADHVCNSIYHTKKFLAFHGFPVLRGFRFKCRNITRALNYYERISGSCIATILNSHGHHTYYINGVKKLKEVCKKASDKGIRYFLLEESPKGCHVCIAVVADQAVAALAVEPTCIQGDGKISIEDLIKQKNNLRERNPWYRDKLIDANNKLKNRLDALGYQMEDVLAEGKKIVIKGNIGFDLSGDTIGITEIVHQDFNEKAVQAVKAIPGLEFAFVHMAIPFPEQPAETQRWAITKIDTNPSVAAFHYPWKGTPCNLVEKVVSNLCLTDRTVWLNVREESANQYLTKASSALLKEKTGSRNGDINTVIQKVKRYHDQNEHRYPLGRRFHYNSRMYLYTESKGYQDTLYSLKSKWGKSREWFIETAHSIPKTKKVDHNLDIEKRYREDSIIKHYKVKLYNKIFFKAFFQEKIFMERTPLEEILNLTDIRKVRDDLLNDEKSLLILSTPAVNFLYNYNYFLEDEEFDPAPLLIVGEKQINIDELSYFHAKIYFYTHAIIGASRFYTEKIEKYRESYDELLNRVENMVLENFKKVSLDQKFETIVCAKLLNADSNIREDVEKEAVQSLSNRGDFFVDVLNDYNNEKNIKTTFSKSEHRNVLGIMAFYSPDRGKFVKNSSQA